MDRRMKLKRALEDLALFAVVPAVPFIVFVVAPFALAGLGGCLAGAR